MKSSAKSTRFTESGKKTLETSLRKTQVFTGNSGGAEIVQKKAQISAVSGRIIEQKVKFIGKEDIKIGDKIYKTLRFNFSSSDPSLSKDKKLNTEIWYEENTFLWVKAAFDKTGYWEYRLKEAK